MRESLSNIELQILKVEGYSPWNHFDYFSQRGEYRMDVRLAEKMITDWAKENADAIGIDPNQIRASYVYNPGGFDNLSIRLTDGLTRLHIKMAPPGKMARLRQWAEVSDYLAEHYTAPRLVHVIDHEIVPAGYPYGLVFEYIEDLIPLEKAPIPDATLLTSIMETIAKLHRDERLRDMLPRSGTRTYAEAFEKEYISRFTEDLEEIRMSREMLRDFVSDETISWFGEEIERLGKTVRQSPAFLLPAGDVVHNDLQTY